MIVAAIVLSGTCLAQTVDEGKNLVNNGNDMTTGKPVPLSSVAFVDVLPF